MKRFHKQFPRGPVSILLQLTFIPILLSSSLVGSQSPSPQQGNPNAATLEVSATNQVLLGEPIELTLTVKGAKDIAGYETQVLFDTAAAEFGGLQQRQNDLKKIGRDIVPLAALDLPNGVAVGLASCSFEDCVAPRGEKKDKGGNGTLKLATITIYPNEPGPLEIRLDGTKFVDAAGNPVDVSVVNPSIVVQVDSGGSSFPAPASMWGPLAASPANPGPFDLTGDGQVSDADAMEIATEWESTRLSLNPCAPSDLARDINHDGCVDVSDLQQLLANESSQGDQNPSNANPANPAASNSDPAGTGGSSTTDAATAAAVTAAGTVFIVNATADGADASIGNGVCATAYGFCTLRAAIQEANAHTGPDTINFNISGTGVKTIQLLGVLPTINDRSGPLTIDGYTQPGASPNSDPLVDNAAIKIQVAGNGETRHDGFVITSPGNVIRGLAVYKMRRAFWIYGSGATNNTIIGNIIGTDVTGSYGAASLVTGAHGLHIEQGAAGTRVGSTALADRNVISGNGQSGVGIWHEKTDNNVVKNNIFGLGPLGDKRVPNRKHGIDLNYGSSSNIIGGTGAGEHNVSSGNDSSGIEVSHTSGTTLNKVVGNYIGTDVTGNQAVAWSYNGYTGITLEDGVTNNDINDNVIGSNRSGGIQITGIYTTYNHIFNNRIGISLNGANIGNSLFGVRADGRDNLIGPNNIIAFNQYTGVIIRENDKDYNTISQNSIYNNGALGIDLLPNGVTQNDPGDADTGPNENLNFPVIQSVTTTQVTGTVCAGCKVEIFIADSSAGTYGEGKTFVGSANADANGNFSVTVSGVKSGNSVTSTATDSAGNTSEFSLNKAVP